MSLTLPNYLFLALTRQVDAYTARLPTTWPKPTAMMLSTTWYDFSALWVFESNSRRKPGVEVVRRNAGRHRGRCRPAVTSGGGKEQEKVRRLSHAVRVYFSFSLSLSCFRLQGSVPELLS